MTKLVEKIIAKFNELGAEIEGDPSEYRIRRTYAGVHQRSAGAFSWFLDHPDREMGWKVSHMGSSYPASYLVKVPVVLFRDRHGDVEMLPK